MKIFRSRLLFSLFFVLLACGTKPLDKRYHDKTMWYDIRIGSNPKNDSINHKLCEMAMAENTRRGVKNEDFTYQELIDQGYDLLAKTHTDTYADSLREVYSKR